jgi:hypothetical protein
LVLEEKWFEGILALLRCVVVAPDRAFVVDQMPRNLRKKYRVCGLVPPAKLT